MVYNIDDLRKSGIYAIQNITTGKYYVGKSSNIHKRIINHVCCLNKQTLDANINMRFDWLEYGRDDFKYEVLEYSNNSEYLKEREYYWTKQLKADEPEFGYNLRIDSERGTYFSDETRVRFSAAQKLKMQDPEHKRKVMEKCAKFWEGNTEAKEKMSKKLKVIKQQFKFHQLDKEGNFIKEWNTVEEITNANPTYKWQNIYSVCNGYKKTIYGYKWIKIKI